MSQYFTGSVALTNGSAVVTGTSTLWLANIAIADGFTIVGSGVTFDVQSVDSDTQITLSAPYTGATAANQIYTIVRDFTPILGLPYPVQHDQDTASLVKTAFLKLDAGITVSSFVHRGSWLIGTTYAKNDAITNGGRYFVSKVVNNTGHTPPASPSTGDAFWGLVSDHGVQGVQGIDGASVDHITRTSGTGAAGTTDTYTMWADVAATISMGTFNVVNGANGANGAKGAAGANSFTVDTRTTTAETVVQADSGGQIKATNAAAIVLTIPAGLVSWQGLAVVQGGAGAVTATAGAGVTLLSVGGAVTTNGQNAVMAILPSGIADTYYIAGNVV